MIVTTLLVAVAGGIGAALRLTVNGLIHSRVRKSYPIALFIINVTGSFLLAFVGGLTSVHLLPTQEGLYVGVGLVGGFTAFSTTSFQTLRLLQEGRYRLAVLNSFGMLAVSVLVAAFGLWLGASL